MKSLFKLVLALSILSSSCSQDADLLRLVNPPWECANGDQVMSTDVCDSVIDCADGSDESCCDDQFCTNGRLDESLF